MFLSICSFLAGAGLTGTQTHLPFRCVDSPCLGLLHAWFSMLLSVSGLSTSLDGTLQFREPRVLCFVARPILYPSESGAEERQFEVGSLEMLGESEKKKNSLFLTFLESSGLIKVSWAVGGTRCARATSAAFLN